MTEPLTLVKERDVLFLAAIAIVRGHGGSITLSRNDLVAAMDYELTADQDVRTLHVTVSVHEAEGAHRSNGQAVILEMPRVGKRPT